MRSVFIVDDEPFILEGLNNAVEWEELGTTLCGKAYDGKEAYEQLRETGCDILITDIMMREMDGLELIRKLKPLHPGMKFIVLSGYNEFNYVKEGMKLGIENYLLKPVNMKELAETIQSTVQKINNAECSACLNAEELDILRDNVMNRWAAGRIDPAELKNRLDFLDIPSDLSCYAAAVVREIAEMEEPAGESPWYKARQNNREVYALCRELTESAGNVRPGICFCDLEGDVIIVYSGSDPKTLQAGILEQLEQMRSALKERGTRVMITLGGMESGYLGLPQSYALAKRLQEFFLTDEEGEIITASRMAPPDDAIACTAPDTLEYEKRLLARNKAAVDEYIDHLFAVRQSNRVSPVHIRNLAVELVLCTKQVVKENKLNYDLATSGYKQLFTALFKAQTLGRLAQHVKFIAHAAIDYLSVEEDEFSPVIKQVLHQIRTKYAEEMSLKTLAHEFNVHPFYLGQLFQKETGVSFSDYLNSHRVKQAKALLTDTLLKTSEISRRVGYLEPGYFYRQFKKYAGMSPTEFRNMVKMSACRDEQA
ncbi:response regulator transcription factor [Paenibacillus sp. VCA1]|uniref:response regulator transcription factor n=1 Tax=Paenibacillus sp. VCA1 TaxID=3039148 RepID=UPI0028721864|nr:response regulator transcription factor [Paenibacillus sp. VCA1]MDR9856251.1 response regulator transcription factor [Paenibacillus sp. VCA1]